MYLQDVSFLMNISELSFKELDSGPPKMYFLK